MTFNPRQYQPYNNSSRSSLSRVPSRNYINRPSLADRRYNRYSGVDQPSMNRSFTPLKSRRSPHNVYFTKRGATPSSAVPDRKKFEANTQPSIQHRNVDHLRTPQLSRNENTQGITPNSSRVYKWSPQKTYTGYDQARPQIPRDTPQTHIRDRSRGTSPYFTRKSGVRDQLSPQPQRLVEVSPQRGSSPDNTYIEQSNMTAYSLNSQRSPFDRREKLEAQIRKRRQTISSEKPSSQSMNAFLENIVFGQYNRLEDQEFEGYIKECKEEFNVLKQIQESLKKSKLQIGKKVNLANINPGNLPKDLNLYHSSQDSAYRPR